MARIDGADPGKQGLLQGLFTRIIYSMVKRKVGRVVMPAKIAAHHAKLLWGYGQMEQSLLSSHLDLVGSRRCVLVPLPCALR